MAPTESPSVTQVVGLTQMRGCMRIPLRCVPVRQTCCRKAAPVSIHTPCGEWSTIESSQVVIDSCLCTSPSPSLPTSSSLQLDSRWPGWPRSFTRHPAGRCFCRWPLGPPETEFLRELQQHSGPRPFADKRYILPRRAEAVAAMGYSHMLPFTLQGTSAPIYSGVQPVRV